MVEITDEYLPSEVKEVFELADLVYESVIIKSITYLQDDIIVLLEFDLGEDSPKQFWALKVIDAQDEKIVRTWATYVQVYTDHYLLWPFTDEEAELCINGTNDAPEKLVADFYSLHQAAFGEWLAIDCYVSDLPGKAKSKFAQFAKGPKRILEYYASWLASHGRNPYFLNFEGLTNANARVVRVPLKLLTFGECYFIGKEFVFTKRSA